MGHTGQQRPHSRQLLALEQRLLLLLYLLTRALAFDRPAKLNANLPQGVEQRRISRQRLTGIKLQHPHYLLAYQERKGIACRQTALLCSMPAQERRVGGHIYPPCRSARSANATNQALARCDL